MLANRGSIDSVEAVLRAALGPLVLAASVPGSAALQADDEPPNSRWKMIGLGNSAGLQGLPAGFCSQILRLLPAVRFWVCFSVHCAGSPKPWIRVPRETAACSTGC